MIKHIACAMLAFVLGIASLALTCYIVYPITTIGPLTTDAKLIIWGILIASFLVPFIAVIYLWRLHHVE